MRSSLTAQPRTAESLILDYQRKRLRNSGQYIPRAHIWGVYQLTGGLKLALTVNEVREGRVVSRGICNKRKDVI